MLKLGVPSKGRLMDQTFDWFHQRGITLRRAGSEREYAGAADGIAGLELVLLSAGEIPRELAAGRIHLGVTGSDLVRDRLADWDRQVTELAPLGFGRADLIIAVPASWPDVDTLDDLDAAAAAFRRTHGHRLRIATKYHRLVRDFLTRHGVADYQLVDSQGATEGTVKNLTAEAIADITSTGETLRANHLKILADGLIHQSQATLYAARTADWGRGARAVLADLAHCLGVDPSTVSSCRPDLLLGANTPGVRGPAPPRGPPQRRPISASASAMSSGSTGSAGRPRGRSRGASPGSR